MKSIKLLKKFGVPMVVIQSLKNEILNEHEIQKINGQSHNLIKIESVDIKRKMFVINYNVNNFIPLSSVIKEGINREKFIDIILNIIESIDSLKTQYINLDFILFDINYVMVNPYNQSIYYIFVPIQDFKSEYDIKTLFKSLLSYGVFDPYESTQYIETFKNILINKEFSLYELKEYANNLKHSTGEEPLKKKYPSLGYNFNGTDVLNYYENNDDKSIVVDPLNLIDKDHEDDQYKKDKYNHEETRDEEYSDTTPLDGGTTPLDGGTTSLWENPNVKPKRPYLVNVNTSQQILISSDIFNIGRLRINDLSFPSNTIVSKKHAKILKKRTRYYLYDTDSFNGTFVDGRKVDEAGIELFDGCKVTFGNEEYIFKFL